MTHLSSAQVAYLEKHIADQTDTELLTNLLKMSSTELVASIETHDNCLYLPMVTAAELAALPAPLNPWIGEDGRLIGDAPPVRYAWQDL